MKRTIRLMSEPRKRKSLYRPLRNSSQWDPCIQFDRGVVPDQG